MNHDQSHGGTERHGVGHIVPFRVLTATAIALLILTAITVWAAGFDFGAGNVWVALGIAALKGSLVALFFMHLRWDRPFNAIVFVIQRPRLALSMTNTINRPRRWEPSVRRRIRSRWSCLDHQPMGVPPRPTHPHCHRNR